MKLIRLTILITATLIALLFTVIYQGCGSANRTAEYKTDTLFTNSTGTGNILEFYFHRGPEHNHPLMALWITDTAGNYIQTLYVAESIAKGIYGHGDKSTGKWLPGPIRRPATLPVWAHNRGIMENDGFYIPTQDNAIPDAYTGATPPAHFLIHAKTDKLLPESFLVWFEINQTWDWNNYWTNNKFPDDEDYKTSCQPALVYRARVSSSPQKEFTGLELIGHSHYSGKDGKIYTDLCTITTAKEITEEAKIRVVE